MTGPEFSFIRYLAAKKSLDDRSLNHQVREAMTQTLVSRPGETPLKVLEVGCGIGTMVERLLDWGLIKNASYTGVDLEPECLAEAQRRLHQVARERNLSLREEEKGKILLSGPEQKLSLSFQADDVLAFAAQEAGRSSWDLLIAHAFLDLVDLDTVLPGLFSIMRPGRWFYFTLNIDGATVLLPPIEAELDRRIETLYHRTMIRRFSGGNTSDGSRTGRRLFEALPAAGGEVLAAGSSDWVVFPEKRRYPEDEAYFLHVIIHTIQGALTGHPDMDQERLQRWAAQRHAQVEQGELIYLAHQLDFFGRVP